MGSTVVLCALRFEADSLSGRLPDWVSVRVTGPGRMVVRGVERAAEEEASLVVLAGLCGGLRPTEPCPPITAVLDREGRALRPTVPALGGGEAAFATIVGVEEPIALAREKHELAAATGADLVDCESHVFGAACEDAGLRWSVVKGVSDGPRTALPAGVSEWVDEDGRTSLGRVAGGLLRRPWEIPAAAALGVRSNAAMRAVAGRLRGLVEGAFAGASGA